MESDFLIFFAAWNANLTCSDPVTALLRKPPSVFVYQLCLPFNPAPPIPHPPAELCLFSAPRSTSFFAGAVMNFTCWRQMRDCD